MSAPSRHPDDARGSLPRTEEVDGLTVADVMHAGVTSMPATVTVGELRELFTVSASRRLAVIADDGCYAAALTPRDLQHFACRPLPADGGA